MTRDLTLYVLIHNSGEGVERDFKMASDFYIKATEAGDPIASYNLSLLYYDGRGVEKDLEKSLYYATKSANDGVLPARVGLLECENTFNIPLFSIRWDIYIERAVKA